jgi:hypothetical protein
MRDESIKHLFVTHNVLANIDIFMKAYSDILVVHIVRNPIDLVYSWFKKGYGKIGTIDGLHMNTDINIHNTPLPWFAKDWSSDCNKLSEVDIVIRLIRSIYDYIDDALNSLSHVKKKKIFFVKYEDLVMNTESVIENIGDFLNAKPSEKLNEVLIKEKCPNASIMDNHNIKKSILFEEATDVYAEILKKMEKKYNASVYF